MFCEAPPLAPAALSDTSSGRGSELDERWDFDQTVEVPGDDT
jgi:hypothetical protein